MDRGYLTEDEIKIILKKKMVSERLEHVRDLFVFSCFCGLAYSDVAICGRRISKSLLTATFG